MAASRSRLSQHWRFGLGSLLLLVAGFAAIFGSYRFGYDHGIAAGKQTWFNNHEHPVVYNVGDVNRASDGEADFDTLINTITTEIEPSTWSIVGGAATILPVSRDQMIISQVQHVHDQVQEFLQSLRDGRRRLTFGRGEVGSREH